MVAVDREAAALDALRRGLRARSRRTGTGSSSIVPALGDFRDPGTIEALRDLVLDGGLFANALHFDPDPGATLQAFARRMRPHGRLVVVEYQDRPPNPWVPHPLPVARLHEVAAEAELGEPEIVGERPSSYGGMLYCARIEVE